MKLETMEPNPVWTEEAYADSVDVLATLSDEVRYKIWGGDWCIDCRSQLPDFGAALAAAGVPDDRVEHYPVEKAEDGSKTGPGVEEYGIELIPTVVVEHDSGGTDDGEEVTRFVEEEAVPIAVYLSRELEELAAS
jgi:thiol-disulfide isomerase/thioredoxin